MSEHSYSIEHYRVILRKAKKLGYALPHVADVARGLPEHSFFLIRHDVDITPTAALQMARVEVEEGVTTTYYFRFHAPFYNLMNPAVVDQVLEIKDQGHEVGLHYEPGFFLDRGQDPVQGTLRDIEAFEALIGQRTQTIAQHQPAQGPLLEDISKDHPCAYQRALVRDIPYFGDSGFHWREGCVCTKLGQHPQLHTLIHPHSWVVSGKPWQDVLRHHATELGQEIDAEMAMYITEVEEYLANRERLDREREAQYGDE